MPHGLARVKNAVVDGTTGLILTENNDILYPGLPSDGQTKGPRFIKEQNEAIEKISINTREAEIEDGVIACLGSKYFGHNDCLYSWHTEYINRLSNKKHTILLYLTNFQKVY